MSVLAVADEPVEWLWSDRARTLGADLVLGAGDLPFGYLEHLSEALSAPCVFVPGNHDRDLTGYRTGRGGVYRAGMPVTWPGPVGAVDADARIVRESGLQIAGLGGSMRYSGGPNQWSEAQQCRRAMRMLARDGIARGRAPVDILLTHSPPRDVGDGDDPAHRGFGTLRGLVRWLRPSVMLHGHIHPFGRPAPDVTLGTTRVINTVGYTLLTVTPGQAPTIVRRHHGS